MKMIMLQMNPQNWKQVLKGKKVMQINKRRPKEEPPYCILVCLKGKGVVGQFTCNEIIEMLDSEDVTAEPKKVYGLKISDPIEYANVHPYTMYKTTAPARWKYYTGLYVPDLITINNLATRCGYFYNAKAMLGIDQNYGYNCNHPYQKDTKENGVGNCKAENCPLKNVLQATWEDCERYGVEYMHDEYMLVWY